MVARTKYVAPWKVKKAFQINALLFTFRGIRQVDSALAVTPPWFAPGGVFHGRPKSAHHSHAASRRSAHTQRGRFAWATKGLSEGE